MASGGALREKSESDALHDSADDKFTSYFHLSFIIQHLSSKFS
jgi:hypothetical protein